MKKFGLILYLLVIIDSSFPQTLFIEENFNYSEGTLTEQSSNWIENPSGSVDIKVVVGSLNYANYQSSGVGNKIVLNGGADGRSGVMRSFTTQSENGSKIFASFLLKVTSTEDMDLITSDGDRFFNFKVSGSSSFRTCIFIRQGSTSELFQVGLGKSNLSTPSWYLTELNISNTFLIVVAYEFQSGSDIVKMWVNPLLDGVEPLADLEQTSGSDADNLGEIQFRQEPLSGDMEIDGLRLADSWSLAPLPVELNSFTVKVIDEEVKLDWKTETEVHNYGFEIERASSNPKFEIRNPKFEMIGFVAGNGNSNSPKEYSFIDKNVLPGNYLYRLKQIDTDGKFEYSKSIQISIKVPDKFELSRNYPNPFNPATTINYSVPEKSFIRLEVFNILGKNVDVLFEGLRNKGSYSQTWNAERFPSGIYFLRFYALNNEHNKSIDRIIKMTLLK